jgi:hypothetical protein
MRASGKLKLEGLLFLYFSLTSKKNHCLAWPLKRKIPDDQIRNFHPKIVKLIISFSKLGGTFWNEGLGLYDTFQE